jgi:poly-gamma-glutamate synthesis protein (capsule biosynthesis protein)
MAKVPIVKEIKGSKIGILGYNQIPPLTNTAAPENITNEINELKNQVDLIVVAFHWGTEYVSKPNTNQVALAHQAVDAGADLIIGDHPHWVGAIEFYKEKPIFYSVGNFVFDQMWSTETRQGIIVLAQYENNRLSKISLLPTQIEESCQPRILNFEEGKVVLQKIFSVSDKNSLKKLEEYN